VTDDAENDPIAARRVGEAGHRARAAPHLAEGALDDVRGADLAPVGGRESVEGQQLFQVTFHASDRPGTQGAPLARPALENPLGGLPTGGLIHCRRFAPARAFFLRYLVGDVPQLVRQQRCRGTCGQTTASAARNPFDPSTMTSRRPRLVLRVRPMQRRRRPHRGEAGCWERSKWDSVDSPTARPYPSQRIWGTPAIFARWFGCASTPNRRGK
jgi:hypothetical protein